MDKATQDEWVIEEDEAAHEALIIKKHQNTKEEEEAATAPADTHEIHIIRKNSILVSTYKKTTSYLNEELTLLFLFTILPYILGALISFLLIPLWAGVGFGTLLMATDFSDWSTHFIFWSVGYLALSFSSITFLLVRNHHSLN